MSAAKKIATEPLQTRLEEEIEIPDCELTCVRISEFYSPRKVAFELFLRLGENKYLRIWRTGETYEEAELKAYETDRAMRTVFFRVENREAYINASVTLLQKITPLPAIPLRTKFGVARILAELYIQCVLEAHEDARAALVDRGREICSVLAAWIDSQAGLERHLLNLDQIEAGGEEHGFLTGMFACVLANQMPWKSRRTNETLLLACFLLDIGLSVLPPDLVRLKPKRMNAQQKRQYEKHPEAAYFLLADLGSSALNENVLTIVRQHHEYCDGTGYPRGIKQNETLMLSKLVVLCGDVVRSASDFLLPPRDAARMMFPDLTEKLFQQYPEIVAKYEKELLIAFFKVLVKEGGA
jgi:HD-GYP domain-containing protein (c-di-GMP phosphodiesterase class II)